MPKKTQTQICFKKNLHLKKKYLAFKKVSEQSPGDKQSLLASETHWVSSKTQDSPCMGQQAQCSKMVSNGLEGQRQAKRILKKNKNLQEDTHHTSKRCNKPCKIIVITFDGVTIVTSSPDILKNIRPLSGAQNRKAPTSISSRTSNDEMEAYDP